jgi:hypothetical protein
VVPLLVVVELLGQGGTGLARALTFAGIKALVTLSAMSFAGRSLLDPIFFLVAKSGSQEAFLSMILVTVLVMSFVTQGIGLSNTLGAFLAGLLLSETRYRYQIEADIAPFRGLLLGFFFITVGFSIDLKLLLREAPTILAMLGTLIAGKAGIITLLSMAFGVSFSNAQHCGLLNSQGGEFAFVAFGIAERSGLISPRLKKMLLTTVALSMAATPMLAELGESISNKIDQKMGFKHYVGQDSEAAVITSLCHANSSCSPYSPHINRHTLYMLLCTNSQEVKSAIKQTEFVFVCGYGRVGKIVCDMLDRLFVRYVSIDMSPQRAIEARNKGLPVFYGISN